MTLSDSHIRRRRLRFRARHRGMREMDLLMGSFVDAELDTLSAADVTGLDALLDIPDADLSAWLTGQAPVPADQDTPLFRRLRLFHSHDRPIHV
jgi:antitoxin CptB